MNKQRKTSHILNVFQYDPVTSVVTLPSGLVLPTPDSAENSTKVATTAWIRAYVGSLSYATVSAVDTAIANLVASAPTTLNTLNELATALGNDPNFATTITTSIGTKVPQSRTISINGTAYDLSADRAWTIASGVTSFNTRTGAITLTSGDVTGALGYTPYNSTNPSGYITGISSGMVTTALGYTPYNSSNPSGYLTQSTADARYIYATSSPNTAGNFVLSIGNNGTYSYVQSHSGQPLELNPVGNAVRIAGQTVIHSGNIGSQSVSYAGSAGNASTLGGYGPNQSGGANTIVQRDSNGYIQNSYFYTSGGGSERGTGISYVAGFNSSDYYIRSYTMQGLASAMSGASMNISGNATTTSQREFNYLRVNSSDNLYLDWNYGCSIVGVYSSTRYQGIFAMGNSYKLAIDGSTTGSLYGLAWSHPNAGGIAGNLNTHGLLVMENGTFLAAISGNIKARDGIIAGSYMFAPNYIETNGPVYATIMYDNNDRSFYVDPNSTSRLNAVVYNDLKWVGDQSYGFLGRNVYADTINGRGSDPLEINYYDGGDVRIGQGVNGNKALYAGSLYDSGSRVAISRGEGRQYVEYSRYVYNNGAYSGSGWIEPSDLGVRYAASSNYSNSTGSLSGFDKTNPTFDAVYANNWFRAYGDCGLYSQSYGGHLRRSNGSSFGNWETFGYERNGWSGFCYVHNYLLNIMSNTSGDHGFYQENGNGWTLFYNRGNNCWGIGTDNTYSGDGFRCVKYGSSQYGWTTWSDRRAKENISSITGALDTVRNMRGVYFNYISDEAKNKRVGFIAQELELVLPEAVRYAEEIDEYNVEYAQIVSVLTEAIKEQDAKMTAQEAKIQRLEQLVEQLINQ